MIKEPVFSQDEQLVRLLDREKILNTMNRHCHLMTAHRRAEALEQLWVTDAEKCQTASLGFNRGFFVGMEHIRAAYISMEQNAGETPEAHAMGVGCAEMHTSTTPLVKIADDGKTAQFLSYHIDLVVLPGTVEGMTFGQYFCDLIKENDTWKIWHLAILHDHTVYAGEDYSKVPVERPPEADPMESIWPEADISRTLHEPIYGWETLYDDMPRGHETYEPQNSYGPDGKLGKMYYDRRRM